MIKEAMKGEKDKEEYLGTDSNEGNGSSKEKGFKQG